jgi:hypothetical protein
VAGKVEAVSRNAQYLTEIEAADFLRLKAATLQTWRCTRRVSGPPYVKFGGAVRYPLDGLLAWASSRVVA